MSNLTQDEDEMVRLRQFHLREARRYDKLLSTMRPNIETLREELEAERELEKKEFEAKRKELYPSLKSFFGLMFFLGLICLYALLFK